MIIGGLGGDTGDASVQVGSRAGLLPGVGAPFGDRHHAGGQQRQPIHPTQRRQLGHYFDRTYPHVD